MSRGRPTEFQKLELASDCESCGQPAGYWCVTKSGHLTEYLHSSRHYQARMRDAYFAVAQHPRGIPEGPAAIHFCPVPECMDIWESEPSCEHARLIP